MTTALRSIFAKPVDRPIDGVIKADDEASLRIELDEYVITDEIGKRLETFLDAYNNYDTANGVWISGFFGSGKSHLLKMLALLMENREVDGARSFDIFEEKLTDQPMLLGALRKAVSVPSKSILFNIDQKADVISKTDVDALLSVFQKVFDEACGYYGKLPHIAQFERDLDDRGQLAAFKDAYAAAAGKPWERGREQAALERKNIATAFAAVTGGDPADAADILGQYRADTRVSIEDFAIKVKAWIDKQGPKFRLNFFVRGRPVHRRERQADDEPANHRRKPEHKVQRAGLGDCYLSAGHGSHHWGWKDIPVARLLENHGALWREDATELGRRG